MRLSFQVGDVETAHTVKIQFLFKFIFVGQKKFVRQYVSVLIATKRAVFPYQGGCVFTTKWAAIAYQPGGIGHCWPDDGTESRTGIGRSPTKWADEVSY